MDRGHILVLNKLPTVPQLHVHMTLSNREDAIFCESSRVLDFFRRLGERKVDLRFTVELVLVGLKGLI